MDAVLGVFAQGLVVVVVVGFYLFVGVLLATTVWFVYHRVHDRRVAHKGSASTKLPIAH